MADFKRTDRVAETMQRQLALLIQQEIKDPRLPGLITISAVRVTRDLGHAKIYFTVFNGEPAETETILNSASSFLRGALAKVMKLRMVPQLHFVYDQSIEYGSRLSRLIDEVNPPDEEDDAS